MKKIVLLVAAGLFLGGAAFAAEENAALGFGVISQSSNQGVASKNLRFNLFLDAGAKLYGPFFYGFEIQGDVQKLDQSSFDVQSTDISAFGLGGGDYVIFLHTSQWTTTYTLWDLDISPRAYISFDLGNKIQLLGFGGFNYNWQTLDVNTKLNSGGPEPFNGKTLNDGDSTTVTHSTDGNWALLVGARLSVGFFYLDYTRFLQADTTGDYSFDQYTKNRWGLGINLRF